MNDKGYEFKCFRQEFVMQSNAWISRPKNNKNVSSRIRSARLDSSLLCPDLSWFGLVIFDILELLAFEYIAYAGSSMHFVFVIVFVYVFVFIFVISASVSLNTLLFENIAYLGSSMRFVFVFVFAFVFVFVISVCHVCMIEEIILFSAILHMRCLTQCLDDV